MLTTQRKQQILAILKREGQVIAKDVAESMEVSEDTIRRDLRELAQEGRLQRVHGGALPASPAIADFAGRELLTAEGKVAIGRAAAGMIRAGQVVILDGGTTARQVARHIPAAGLDDERGSRLERLLDVLKERNKPFLSNMFNGLDHGHAIKLYAWNIRDHIPVLKRYPPFQAAFPHQPLTMVQLGGAQ